MKYYIFLFSFLFSTLIFADDSIHDSQNITDQGNMTQTSAMQIGTCKEITYDKLTPDPGDKYGTCPNHEILMGMTYDKTDGTYTYYCATATSCIQPGATLNY